MTNSLSLADQLFAAQHGVASRRQLLDLGVTARMIEGRLGNGRWVAVHQRVYRTAGAPPSDDQRLMAAILAARPGSAIAGRTAAVMWGTRTFGSATTELIVPTGRP